MAITYILFLIGFVVLIKGADLLVDGASSLARRLGVSSLVIGLTIVAFGTSAPELVVNILASFHGSTDIAIGNILGSNIANTLLILGISSIIYPLAIKKGTVWREIPLNFLAVIVLAFLANNFLTNDLWLGLSRSDGLILILFFATFLYYIFGVNKTKPADSFEIVPQIHPLWKSSFMILVGLLGLTLGGKWIVNGAILFAKTLGVSEALIGLTVVAIGTSLPELATSAVAAYKKDIDIAVGNVIGSNIFNIFWVLGASAIIRPLPFSKILMEDVFVATFSVTILFIFLLIGKKHILQRWQGVFFVLLYISYIGYLFIRG